LNGLLASSPGAEVEVEIGAEGVPNWNDGAGAGVVLGMD